MAEGVAIGLNCGDEVLAFVIEVPARIHVSLLSMSSGLPRINGSAGFAISKSAVSLRFASSTSFSINAKAHTNVSPELLERLKRAAHDWFQKTNCVPLGQIEIVDCMPEHFGFGVTTSAVMALLEGLSLLAGMPLSQSELQAVSRRGGTSGIGINTYFSGGFVIDLGQRPHTTTLWKPSDAHEGDFPLPLPFFHRSLPNWKIGVCIPKMIAPKSVSEEKSFFLATCPIPPLEAYQATYWSIFGLAGSIIENDCETFASAIKAIQSSGWKQAERRQYGTLLSSIEQDLYECGAWGVGMSSFGPSLYFLAENIGSVSQMFLNRRSDCVFLETEANNVGRKISIASNQSAVEACNGS